MSFNCQRKKTEELLKLDLKIKDKLNGTGFSSKCNFGFGINEYINLGPKFGPITGIYGMDFFIVIDRKGKRIARRKYQRSRL